MKRTIAVFGVLLALLSLGLWIRVRALGARARAPVGSSAVIEGVEVDVTARLTARVDAVQVDEGALVSAGQVLVRLDCREPKAQLDAANAQLAAASGRAAAARAQIDGALAGLHAAQARASATGARSRALSASRDVTSREAKRIKQLQGEGGSTALEVDRVSTRVSELTEQLTALELQQRAARGQARAARAGAQAARKQAEAAVAAVRAATADVQRAATLVEECKLKAPIAGRVQTRAMEPGELALPGSRVLTLVRLDPVEVTFYVSNAEIAAAAPGERVTVEADAYPGKPFHGTISRVSAEAEFTPRNVQTRDDRDRLVYAVKAVVPNPSGRLRSGMPVQVTIDGTAGGAWRSR